jgi:hypothetical protein
MKKNKHLLNRIFFGIVLFSALLIGASTEVQAAGVSLSANPAANTATVGQTAVYTININRDGYTDKVTLSATNLPAGATAAFTPNTTTATSSVLTVKTLSSTPVGTFIINVKATAAGVTIAPITVKLTTTPAQSITLTALPDTQSIVAGQSTSYDLTIERTGFNGPVALSVENLPAGLFAVFEPQETTGNTSRMRLYSNGLPPVSQNFEVRVIAKALGFDIPKGLKILRVNVNCNISWAEQGFPENNGNPDFATAVAADANGNVYVAGHVFSIAQGTTEIWVAKYSSANGARLWMRTLALGNNTAGLAKQARAIIADSAGNVYVAGYTLVPNVNNQADFDIFVANLDANGTPRSTLVFGGSRREDGTGGMEFGLDSAGRAVLTTTYDIRRDTITHPFLPDQWEQANFDIRRITYNPDLSVFASQIVISDTFGDPKDLTVGRDGSVYVAGRDLFVPLQPPPPEWPIPPYYLGMVKRFGAGSAQSYTWTDPDYFPTRVAVDGSGNAFFGGQHQDDVWVAKLNSAQGSLLWRQTDSTPVQDVLGDLTVDASGNLVYAGMTRGNLSATNPDANFDGWIAKRTTGGSLDVIRQFAVADKDDFQAITIDSAGFALLAGDTVNFKQVNYGYEDILLVKFSLAPSPPIFFTPTISGVNPTSVRGGTTFTISGTNLTGTEIVSFDGQALRFTVDSSTRITATAPAVTAARTGNITISSNCRQFNSPTRLTVTP